MSFIFGGNTEMSYEDLQRKRRIADAMIGQNSNAPRNVGEGLAAIGRALAARAIDKRVSAREKELQSDADKMWQAAMGGLDMGGMYGSSAGYSGASGGGYSAAPYTPDATDPAEIGGGGYALGDSVASPEMVASPKGDLAMGSETYSPADRELLAKTLMAEAGGEGPGGMLAAGAVIDNRRKAGGYGNDWQGVIMKPGQFSAWNGVTGYAGGKGGLNMDGMKPSQAAYQVADALLSGRYDDPTGGATHYYNPAAANPAWGMQAGGDWQRIGNHVFGTADAGRGQGGGQGGGGYSGPSIAAIAQAMANPMIRNDPGKMLIANMLMQRSMQASDPMYQLQLQQAQLQLEQARKGPKREIVKGADGFNYYLDTSERVLPNVQAAPPAKPGSVQEYEYGLQNPGYNDWSRANKEAGATKINMEGEKAYDKEIGKNLAEKTTGIIDAGMAAPNKIAEYKQLGQALANSYTGTGGDTVLALKKIGTAMGWDVGDVGDAELAKALGNKLALELRNPAGGAGMPGAMSDKDREFLVSSVPGLSKTQSGNAKLVEMAIAVQERNAKVAEMANRYMDANGGRLDRGFFAELAQWSAKNPLFDYNLPPEPAETPAPPSAFNSDGKMPEMSDADKAYLKELGFEVD